jgi:hypothetical protein
MSWEYDVNAAYLQQEPGVIVACERAAIIAPSAQDGCGPWLLDFTFQMSRGHPRGVDYWVLALIRWHTEEGRLTWFYVDVGTTPNPDRMVRENREALSSLPDPFMADVHGVPNALDDGCLFWESTAPCLPVDENGIMPYSVPREGMNPNIVPLEIGTTTSATTIMHIYRERGLARWPYGSTAIEVLVWTQAFKSWQEGSNGCMSRFLQ